VVRKGFKGGPGKFWGGRGDWGGGFDPGGHGGGNGGTGGGGPQGTVGFGGLKHMGPGAFARGLPKTGGPGPKKKPRGGKGDGGGPFGMGKGGGGAPGGKGGAEGLRGEFFSGGGGPGHKGRTANSGFLPSRPPGTKGAWAGAKKRGGPWLVFLRGALGGQRGSGGGKKGLEKKKCSAIAGGWGGGRFPPGGPGPGLGGPGGGPGAVRGGRGRGASGEGLFRNQKPDKFPGDRRGKTEPHFCPPRGKNLGFWEFFFCFGPRFFF